MSIMNSFVYVNGDSMATASALRLQDRPERFLDDGKCSVFRTFQLTLYVKSTYI